MKRIVFVLLAFSTSACADQRRQESSSLLSPRNWPEDELQTYARRNAEGGSSQPPVGSIRAVVAGTTGPLAIRAGCQALRQGGSAVDAAITVALSQITLSGGAWNSFAGICHILYYTPSTGEIYALNAAYDIPSAEKDPQSIPSVGTPSGRGTLVPGFMAGVEAAHHRFGKLPFSTLFEPALFFAEEGFTIDAQLGGLMESRKDVLARFPETRGIFQKADGSPYRTGDLFCQPSLARTLRRVVAEGARYMYQGPWAEKLVQAVQSQGGKLTLEDLKRYQVQWPQPLRARYRDREVVTGGFPDFGPVHLVEALHLLGCTDLRQMGVPDRSPRTLYTLIQASRLGPLITHSQAYHPYPDAIQATSEFSPEQRVLANAGHRNWERLQKSTWQGELGQQLFQAGRGTHSDAIVAVDRDGNIAVMVHTINCPPWGGTGLSVDGICIPDSASFQQAMITKVGSGRRLPSEIAPVIVLEKGRPLLAVGCIGAALQETMLQNLVLMLDFGMDLNTAVHTPKFLGMGSEAGQAGDWMRQIIPEDAFSQDVTAAVQDMGQPVMTVSSERAPLYRGYPVGVELAPGGLRAVVGPGLNGIAVGD